MSEMIVRPDLMENEYLEYLDQLRDSGVVNMYGSPLYLAEEFELETTFACQVVTYWMKTYSDRHPAASANAWKAAGVNDL